MIVRNTFACLGLAIALLTSCQTARPSTIAPAVAPVWKVTARDGHALYLGGTVHLLRPADLPPPAEFDEAFAAADAVFFETEIARLQSVETLGFLMREGVYRDGQTLQSVLTPEAWAAIEAYCAGAGLPLAMMERFKPWMFVMNVTVLELQKIGVAQQGIDFIYAQKAADAGKPTSGLESYETHIGYLTGMGRGHESEMILSTLRELQRMRETFVSALASWRTGDLERMDELLVQEMREQSPDVYQELLVGRNQKWLPQLEEMLRTDPVELVLVGAGHLSGKDGLLKELLARGYTITPVVAATTDDRIKPARGGERSPISANLFRTSGSGVFVGAGTRPVAG